MHCSSQWVTLVETYVINAQEMPKGKKKTAEISYMILIIMGILCHQTGYAE